MTIPIPIVNSLIDAGKTILDKLFMDKKDKEMIQITKDQLKLNFETTLKQMVNNQELEVLDRAFKEYEAQRQFANDQFGTMNALKEMGWVGKIIALGRASIRWVITAGSMLFTWNIMKVVLTRETILALIGGTLSSGGTWLIVLLVTLIIGIPVFYVSGVSIEKILGVRSKL